LAAPRADQQADDFGGLVDVGELPRLALGDGVAYSGVGEAGDRLTP
jgi:hypothetical protein